jgi:hypothetical protein
MSTRRPPPNYFQKHRPQGDSLKAKVARAQIEAADRPITLPKLKFMELPLDEEEAQPS